MFEHVSDCHRTHTSTAYEAPNFCLKKYPTKKSSINTASTTIISPTPSPLTKRNTGLAAQISYYYQMSNLLLYNEIQLSFEKHEFEKHDLLRWCAPHRYEKHYITLEQYKSNYFSCLNAVSHQPLGLIRFHVEKYCRIC